MRLSEVFKEVLKEKGITRIWPCTDMWKLSALVAENRAVVCKARNCRISMNLDEKCEMKSAQACVIPASKCDEVILSGDELLKRAGRYPFVLIDCRYHSIHTEKELRRLRLQLKCTVGVIRKFMWSGKMIVTGKKFPEVETPFYREAEEFFKEKNIEKILLLDPNAEEEFSNNDKYDCYVIGGIVDLCGNKKGLTSKLGRELERSGVEVISKKFTLKGDVTGVPDRINSIAEILLMCVIDGKNVEEAIYSVQSPLVARWRLRKELAKLSFRLDKLAELDFPVRAVKKQDLKKLEWLKIREKDFYRECRKLGFYVIDESFLKTISGDEYGVR